MVEKYTPAVMYIVEKEAMPGHNIKKINIQILDVLTNLKLEQTTVLNQLVLGVEAMLEPINGHLLVVIVI